MNTIFTIILTIIILILLLILKDLFFESRIKKINKILPGPSTIPVFGNLLQIDPKDFPKSVNDFYERYGKIFRLRFGSVEIVVLTGPELIDECFNKKHREIFKERYIKFSRFFGKDRNIISSNGDYHYVLRGILTSEITTRKLNNDRLQTNKFIFEMFDNLCKHNEKTLVKDVPNQIRILAVKLILNFTLGIEEDDETILIIVKKITSIFEAAGLLIYSDYLPFLFPLDIKSMSKSDIISNYFYIKNFICKKLHSIKIKVEKELNNETTEETSSKPNNVPIIENYYKNYLDGSIHYDSILFSIADVIFAAVDSTSNGFSFLIGQLINEPEIQDKIYEEIMRNDKNNNSKNISFADHTKYPYIISVINESYRYNSSVPITEPNKTTEDVEVNGYKIAKGTMIIKNLRGTHLSKEFWGEDALEFKPERFKNQTLNQKGLFTFGAGPRGCPGGRFTECFTFTFLVTMLKSYKIVNPTDFPIDVEGEVGLAMQCKPFDALFIKRN
ncbi:hypothetical protein ACTFIZ_011839 [Dictyostelium cf. discoideum]